MKAIIFYYGFHLENDNMFEICFSPAVIQWLFRGQLGLRILTEEPQCEAEASLA